MRNNAMYFVCIILTMILIHRINSFTHTSVNKNTKTNTGVSIIDAVLGKDEKTIKEIITATGKSNNVNDIDPKSGGNSLHFIAKIGHYTYPPSLIPKTLIDAGIDMNKKNNDGVTPLEISLLSGWQKISMLLLDNGADRSVVTQATISRITCPDCKRVVKEYKLG